MRISKKTFVALFVEVVLIGVIIAARSHADFPLLSGAKEGAVDTTAPTAADGADTGTGAVILACTGRVEGTGEAISVGAGIDGVIADIRVKEGDAVIAGAVLAVIERRELAAELGEARAAVERARASRARLERGGREDEQARAAAQTQAAAAMVKQAKARYERFESLCKQGVIATDTCDEALRNYEVAKANLGAAQRNEEVVKAAPLPEEMARADADIRAAEGRVRTLTEQARKCDVRAPVSGTVLRVNMRAGEAYSTFTPQPILTVADTSGYRVRAEVDERDVGKIFIGQNIWITGDGFGGRRLPGRVSHLSSQMGRKKVRTGDPAEKSDRDVLEVLVDVEGRDPALFVGLRVTAQFLNNHSRE